MKVLVKGFVVAIVLVIVSTVAVFSSDSYFKSIEAADRDSNDELTSSIISYLDGVDYEKAVREENNKANQDIIYVNGGQTDSSVGQNEVRPDFETGVDAYLYALNKYKNAKNIIVESTGYADTAVGRQTIKVVRQRNAAGHIYFTVLNYSGFIQVAREVYYDGRIFRQRSSDKVSSSMNPTYSGDWVLSTSYNAALRGYVQKYGVAPDELNYIINKDTVVSEVFDKDLCKQALDAGQNYTFSFVLEPKGAGEKYRYNVKENAGAKNLPNFEKVEVEVTINPNGNFVTLVSRDKYSLTVAGVTSDVKTVVTDNFTKIDDKNFEVTIPTGV